MSKVTKEMKLCMECGLCCTLCIPLTEQDLEALTEQYFTLNPDYLQDKILIHEYVMRTTKDVCVANKNKVCSIYEHRPQICRDFEQGNKMCNRLRRKRGLKEIVRDSCLHT